MSAAALVEKATSDLLIGPDWGRNLELCDLVNNDPGQAKEVVKAAKKRLAIKNSTVQLLTLTVLETLIKNCGDAVHQQVAERDVLHEMVKIVKKKADMNVRDKILSLLDSWQEAFGGQRGRYPQYFAAYDELRRSGVEFPQRDDAVPIFTPPQTHPITAYPPGFPQPYPPPPYAGFVPPEQHMPPNTNVQPLSSSDLDNARGGMEVLQEMLNVMDPHDKAALNGEVIQDLVEQCRITQRQVMNLVNTTTDETLLFQALSLNDDLQKVLAKRDAIASGTPLPLEDAIPVSFAHDEDDSEDDFAQLAHRPLTRNKPTAPSPPKITGPVRIAKLPAPPGASPKQQQAVDLLSGDIFGGTQSAQAAVDNHKPEDPSNINPFASASNGQQQQTATTAQSQQALLYGTPQATPYTPSSSSSSSLPPPPIKYSQRQQYFQQQQEYPRPDSTQDQTEYPPQPQPEYSRTDNDLAVKTQKLSIDQLPDDDMQNPYAALYAQQQAHQEERRRQEKAKEETKFKKTESLFSDLVELQSARMKSRSG